MTSLVVDEQVRRLLAAVVDGGAAGARRVIVVFLRFRRRRRRASCYFRWRIGSLLDLNSDRMKRVKSLVKNLCITISK